MEGNGIDQFAFCCLLIGVILNSCCPLSREFLVLVQRLNSNVVPPKSDVSVLRVVQVCAADLSPLCVSHFLHLSMTLLDLAFTLCSV